MSDEKPSLPVPQLSKEQLTDLSIVGDSMFLRRVSLAQGTSDAVKQRWCGVGVFFLGGKDRDDFVELGTELEVVLGPARAHALTMHEKKVTKESFDPQDEVFKEIQAKAMSRATPKGQGKPAYMFGTEFLVYLVKAKQFAVVPFMKTARREARPLFALPDGAKVKLFAKLIEGKENSWYVPRLVNGSAADGAGVITDGKSHEQALLAFQTGKAGNETDAGNDSVPDESDVPSGGRPR